MLEITQALLEPNEYSRPQTPLLGVEAVVVHYVGNPGSSARNNRDYFNNQPCFPRADRRYVSSHYIIGLAGEVLRCIPEEEMSYCNGSYPSNQRSITIECCHPDATGQLAAPTRESLLRLLVVLCRRYGLDPDKQLLRHYDVTGKYCPLWYVTHPEEWVALKQAVANRLADGAEEPPLQEKDTICLEELTRCLAADGWPDWLPRAVDGVCRWMGQRYGIRSLRW